MKLHDISYTESPGNARVVQYPNAVLSVNDGAVVVDVDVDCEDW